MSIDLNVDLERDRLHPPRTFPLTPEQQQRDLEEIAAVLSHELTDPLREAIPLCAAESPEQRAEGLRQMQLSLRRQSLLRQYVQLGQRPFPLQLCRLQPVVQSAVLRLGERLQRFPAQIGQAIPPDATARLNPDHAATLLALLIDNALIHNPLPDRRVTFGWRQEGEGHCLTVTDNGPGMDTAYRHIIFRLFVRLEAEKAVPGHGVGLSFARRLAELHGGGLEMHSGPEQGTEMRWWLPG